MKSGTLKTAIATALMAGMACSVAASANEFNPYSPAYGHPYRHGVIPTREVNAAMQRWNAMNAGSTSKTLAYGGGTSGVGVMSGANKVYLVFYGTQWGTSSTDANGNLKFTNDSAGAAGAAQQMFKGIGTNGETWSAELTQWCDGSGIASLATTCPASGVSFIPYQQNILAGVWYDNSAASPASATGAQLAQEAINAATHFGNTASGSNRYTYYVILSPKGTNPDNYQSPTQGYCAWHDYTGDGYGVSPTNIAFSNQPYNIDVGSSCGVNFVNSGSAGTLDGYTMTLGHEWHEMMSDTFPAGGWSNHTGGTYNGQENSDECAWIAAGSAGGAANVTFSTGTFTEQASWSNDTNSCAISHSILTHGGGGTTTPTANFSFTTSGLTANFTDSSSDVGGTITAHSWTFGDGGTSTATSPSHTYATGGTYSVTETVTDSGNKTASKTSSVTVSSGGGGGSSQLLSNTGFESGSASWTMSSGVLNTSSSEPPHAGTYDAWMNGYGSTHTDTVSQTVTVPAGKTSGTLSFYLHIDTAETTTTTAYDKLTVALYNGSTLVRTLGTYSNLNKGTGYTLRSFSLTSTDLSNSSLTVKFTGTEDSSLQTSFVLDDVTLTVQ